MNWRKNFCAFLVAVSLLFISATNSSALVSGDVDDDGVVRLADVLLVMRYFAGTQTLNLQEKMACNVNGDSVFPPPIPYDPLKSINCDFMDLALIQQQAWGLIA